MTTYRTIDPKVSLKPSAGFVGVLKYGVGEFVRYRGHWINAEGHALSDALCPTQHESLSRLQLVAGLLRVALRALHLAFLLLYTRKEHLDPTKREPDRIGT